VGHKCPGSYKKNPLRKSNQMKPFANGLSGAGRDLRRGDGGNNLTNV
jgi:hypothetical protein